jgi:hypothetical protein
MYSNLSGPRRVEGKYQTALHGEGGGGSRRFLRNAVRVIALLLARHAAVGKDAVRTSAGWW